MKDNNYSDNNKVDPIPAFPSEGKKFKKIALSILILIFVIIFLIITL